MKRKIEVGICLLGVVLIMISSILSHSNVGPQFAGVIELVPFGKNLYVLFNVISTLASIACMYLALKNKINSETIALLVLIMATVNVLLKGGYAFSLAAYSYNLITFYCFIMRSKRKPSFN